MGGSGGGYFRGSSGFGSFAQQARQAEEDARDSTFEAELADYLKSLLEQYNDRDTEGIRDLLSQIEDALGDTIETAVDLLFGGSISKHTYVDGLSDVDALVCLKDSDVAGKSPGELRHDFAEALRDKFGKDAVTEGYLAVTVTIGDKVVQLLPAVRQGEGFKISSNDGKGWSSIRPRDFAKALTKANEAAGGKLVPTIKLAKAINATLPEAQRLSGYHVESMAIKVFKGYTGSKTTTEMLRHFFEKASTHVKEPIRDSSGQSIHVDEYLGAANSTARDTVSKALSRVSRKMKNADATRSMGDWKSLFTED